MTIKQHNLRKLGHKIQNCLISNAVNPLCPNIHIKILQTDFYTFPKECVKRI